MKRKKYADDLDLNLSDDDDDDEGKTGAHSINESNASFFVVSVNMVLTHSNARTCNGVSILLGTLQS